MNFKYIIIANHKQIAQNKWEDFQADICDI